MKIVRMILAPILSILAVMKLMTPGSLPEALACFVAAYGFISVYIVCFPILLQTLSGSILFGLTFGLLAYLCLPALVLAIPGFILQAFLPAETANLIYGIFFCLASLACIIWDIVTVVRLFIPTPVVDVVVDPSGETDLIHD